jgi:hypothetical protein
VVYADVGWNGWGDYLGNGRAPRGDYLSFKEARAFVHKLEIASEDQWRTYCRSRKKPNDIPSSPEKVYRNFGWNGWSDWLGNGGASRGNYLSFKQARAFARKLGLASVDEWKSYCQSGKKPNEIPAAPQAMYSGWINWPDWLGHDGRVRKWRSFEQARVFVRKLGLASSGQEWRAYCRSGRKPDDIPADPSTVYRKLGWNGWSDWLGNGGRH